MYMDNVQMQQNSKYNLYNLEANFRMYLSAVINLKAVTVKNYLSDLRYFIGWYQRHAPRESFLSLLENLTEEHVASYRAYLQKSNLPEKTINRRLSTVRMFGKYLIDQNIVLRNPASKIVNVGLKQKKLSASPYSTLPLSEFAHFLSEKDYPEHKILQAEKDVREFLSIIDSHTHI